MIKYEHLPNQFKTELVKPYYYLLKQKWFYRIIKRAFDILASFILLLLLLFPCLIVGFLICFGSKGGPFFLQKRIGRYGKPFYIVKFRTMYVNTEGDKHITSKNDNRITKIGKFLRKTHIDEFPQLLNVLIGQMSFVGTRPEVPQFVDLYRDEWNATLLMRPGITSTASISFDEEANKLGDDNVDDAYVKKILPEKMNYNLVDLKQCSFFKEIGTMLKTVFRKKG